MTFTAHCKIAGAAALLLAGTAGFAKDDVHRANPGVRSAQALPKAGASAYHPNAKERETIEKASADPPYCSGNKYGLGNGQGAAHGKGNPFTCGVSPG
jgi:hypothetical protein